MKIIPALKYFMVLFLFTSMGCKEIILENRTFKVGQESTFRINQLYTSSDGQSTLQINEIGDSRCAIGVECFWEGEVTIKGEWTNSQNTSTFELHSVLKEMEMQPDGFTIQIVDAKPYPVYGTESKPEDLVVTLLIKKIE